MREETTYSSCVGWFSTVNNLMAAAMLLCFFTYDTALLINRIVYAQEFEYGLTL